MSVRSDRSDRHRLRKLLYLVGLVPALLLVLLSARIVLLLHQQSEAMSAYTAGNFEDARDAFAANQVLNPVERWVAPFGQGGARYRLEDFDGAVAAFERALESAPRQQECMIRVNLALSHEALGDALEAKNDKPAALDAWAQGRQAIRPCTEKAEPDPQERTGQDIRSRAELEERAQETSLRVDARLVRKIGFDESPELRRPEQAPPEDELAREKKERLEQRNKKAHEDHVEHKDEFDFDPTPPSEEPSPIPQW